MSDRDQRPARVRRRRLVWLVLGVVSLAGLVYVAGYPTRTYLAQAETLSRAEHRLDVLADANAELEARASALHDDAEIERLAREQYGLVRPGEESFAILPAPPPPLVVPGVWPFTTLAETLTLASAEDG